MTTLPPTICISLRYADAPKIYDWLIEAFGFEKLAAFYSKDGRTLLHGELRIRRLQCKLEHASRRDLRPLLRMRAERAQQVT